MRRLTVIITGVTGGLGRATALEFARAGHQVIGIYRTDDLAAAQLTETLHVSSGDSFLVKHDVSIENAALWERPEIQTAEQLVLINNAWAPFTPQPLHLLRWEDFETAWNVGLRGSWLCSLALLRPMVRAGGGAIVNVLTTAVAGLPPKGFAAYATAKHALRGFTLALAAEYASKGIRVFSVSPGFMSTALTAGWDGRFTDAIRINSPITQPRDAARKIREMIETSGAPGTGEDYPM